MSDISNLKVNGTEYDIKDSTARSTIESLVGTTSVGTQIETKVSALTADVTSDNGGDIAVQVIEADGKISAVNVTGISACSTDEIKLLFSTTGA